jgi:hypothetical protein
VLFGGTNGGSVFGDTYEWAGDTTHWILRSSADATLGKRRDAAMTYDATRGTVVHVQLDGKLAALPFTELRGAYRVSLRGRPRLVPARRISPRPDAPVPSAKPPARNAARTRRR